MFLANLAKVIDMFFTHIFNPKVINNKAKLYGTPGNFHSTGVVSALK